MNRLLALLCLATALAISPMLLGIFAWGGGSTGALVASGWLGLVGAGLLGFWHRTPAAVLGFASACAVWGGLVENVGWFLLFHPDNGVLYPVLLLPALLALCVVGVSLWTLLHDRFGSRPSAFAAVGTVCALLAVVPSLFVGRSFQQTHFASFNLDTERRAEMAVMPQPFDTRAFVVPLSSSEVVRAVEAANPDTSAGLYLNNAWFAVKYNFNQLRSVTLEGFDHWQLEQPVTWTASQLRGDKSFLVP